MDINYVHTKYRRRKNRDRTFKVIKRKTNSSILCSYKSIISVGKLIFFKPYPLNAQHILVIAFKDL